MRVAGEGSWSQAKTKYENKEKTTCGPDGHPPVQIQIRDLPSSAVEQSADRKAVKSSAFSLPGAVSVGSREALVFSFCYQLVITY